MEMRVSSRDLAAVLGVSVQRIGRLRKDGVLSGEGDPIRYDLPSAVKAYIEFKTAKPKSESEEAAEKRKAQADADYKRAKADQEQIKLAELQGRMHSSEDVEAATSMLVYSVRSALMALPGRCAVDASRCRTAQEVSALLDGEVRAILEDLSNFEYDPDVYARMLREREGAAVSDVDD